MWSCVDRVVVVVVGGFAGFRNMTGTASTMRVETRVDRLLYAPPSAPAERRAGRV